MSEPSRSGKWVWRIMRGMNRRVARLIARGLGPRQLVLVLTTTGRKSGLPRPTPLQFEEIDGAYYVGSARGERADWYRNVLADPCVQVQARGRNFPAFAETVDDAERVADFLAIRLKRRPVMIGLVMRLEGLPLRYRRADLVRFAREKTLVILHPAAERSEPLTAL